MHAARLRHLWGFATMRAYAVRRSEGGFRGYRALTRPSREATC